MQNVAKRAQSRRGSQATCGTCGTRYVRFGGRVKVMTAYEHEYEKLYHGVTGGDAEAISKRGAKR